MSESYMSQLNNITRVNQDMKYFIFKFASVWSGGWGGGLELNNFEDSPQNVN